jgi:hypothetical protein
LHNGFHQNYFDKEPKRNNKEGTHEVSSMRKEKAYNYKLSTNIILRNLDSEQRLKSYPQTQ